MAVGSDRVRIVDHQQVAIGLLDHARIGTVSPTGQGDRLGQGAGPIVQGPQARPVALSFVGKVPVVRVRLFGFPVDIAAGDHPSILGPAHRRGLNHSIQGQSPPAPIGGIAEVCDGMPTPRPGSRMQLGGSALAAHCQDTAIRREIEVGLVVVLGGNITDLAPTQTVPRAEQRGALEHLDRIGLGDHALELRRKGPLLPVATVADNVVASLEGLGPPDPPPRIQQRFGIPEAAAVLAVADPGAEGGIMVADPPFEAFFRSLQVQPAAFEIRLSFRADGHVSGGIEVEDQNQPIFEREKFRAHGGAGGVLQDPPLPGRFVQHRLPVHAVSRGEDGEAVAAAVVFAARVKAT